MPLRGENPKRPPTKLVPRVNWSHREEEKRADAERIYIQERQTAQVVKEHFIEKFNVDPDTPDRQFEAQLSRWGLRKRGRPDSSTYSAAEIIDLTEVPISPLVRSETPHGRYPSSRSTTPASSQQGKDRPRLGLVDPTSRSSTPAFPQPISQNRERTSSARLEDRSRSSTPAMRQTRERTPSVRSEYLSRAPSRAATPFILEGSDTTRSGYAPLQRPASTVPMFSRETTPAIDNSRRRPGEPRNIYNPQRGPAGGQAMSYAYPPPTQSRYVPQRREFNPADRYDLLEPPGRQFEEQFVTLRSMRMQSESESEFTEDEFSRP